MGLSGAAGGAAASLQDILVERLRQAQFEEAKRQAQAREQQQASQFDATMGLHNRQFGLQQQQFAADEAERQRVAARQTQQDDIAATERRGVENQKGVRRMIGDFLVQRGSQPLDAGSRQTLQGMAIQEDVDLPSQITTDPDAEFREKKRVLDLQHQYSLGEIAAQGAQARQTEAAKTPEQGGASPYAAERAFRTRQAIGDLKGKVNRWTVGMGSMLSGIPESDARNFRAELDTLKANIAFNELAQMREASKTGGALGAVSERELALLESALGALDQGQSPDNLSAQLQRIDDSLARWELARMNQPLAPGTTVNISAPGQVTSGVQRWTRDAQGRPVRAQ